MKTKYSEDTLDFFINWLLQKVSEITGKSVSEIDERIPLANYGLDSLHAVTLSGEIEQWMKINIEPTIAWDYPTVFEMAKYLQNTKQLAVAN